MRPWRFIPFAFLAGVHGFAAFVPYLAIVMAAAHFLRRKI